MHHNIINEKSFAVITGDIGAGKSTLTKAFIAELDDSTIVASISNPPDEILEIFNLLCSSLGHQQQFTKKADFLIWFNKFVKDTTNKNKKIIIIIDEAHKLNELQLEELRLLSNTLSLKKHLINYLLVGQKKLNQILLLKDCAALRLRISYHYEIEPLSKDETDAYIRFRLSAAGSTENIFTKRSIAKIFSFSKGNPRLINMICDRSLLTAFVNSTRRVTFNIAAECAEELRLPNESLSDLASAVNADPTSTKIKNALSIIQLWKKYIYNLSKQLKTFLPYKISNKRRKKHLVIGASITFLSLFTLIYLLFLSFHSDSQSSMPQNVQQTIQPKIKNNSHPPFSSLDDSKKKITAQADKAVPVPSLTSAVSAGIKRPKHSPNPAQLGRDKSDPEQKEVPISNSETMNIASSSDTNINFADNPPTTVNTLNKSITSQKTKNKLSLNSIEKIIDAGDFHRAINLLEQRGIDRNKEDPQNKKLYLLYIKALYGKSRQLLANGKIEKVEKILYQISTLDPDNWQIAFELGNIYSKAKKYGNAIKFYEKSLNINPSHPDVYYNLGFIYSIEKDYKKAETMFLKCANLEPDYLDKIYFNLSLVQYKQGEIRETIKNLNNALRVNPENRRAKIMLERVKAIN